MWRQNSTDGVPYSVSRPCISSRSHRTVSRVGRRSRAAAGVEWTIAFVQIIVERTKLLIRPGVDVPTRLQIGDVVGSAEMLDDLIPAWIPIAVDRPVIAPQRVTAGRFDAGRFEHWSRGAFVHALGKPVECPSVERRGAARFKCADHLTVFDARDGRKLARFELSHELGNLVAIDDLDVILRPRRFANRRSGARQSRRRPHSIAPAQCRTLGNSSP